MKKQNLRGISSLEFAFSALALIPLLLGTGVTGVNMVRTQQTIQVARDAGNMYARGVDFALPGNKTILLNLAANLGLSGTAGSGPSVVVFTSLTYVDKNACAFVGAVDASGNPTAACTNFGEWVFTQRFSIGNTAVRSSNWGSPLTNGPNGVYVDPNDGKIPVADYVKKSGAVVQFSGVNPYSVVSGNAQGLPSGQVLYLAEAACRGFNMPPFVSNANAYSFSFF